MREFIHFPSDALREKFLLLAVASNLNSEESRDWTPKVLSREAGPLYTVGETLRWSSYCPNVWHSLRMSDSESLYNTAHILDLPQRIENMDPNIYL